MRLDDSTTLIILLTAWSDSQRCDIEYLLNKMDNINLQALNDNLTEA
jgi:hypothetical protein